MGFLAAIPAAFATITTAASAGSAAVTTAELASASLTLAETGAAVAAVGTGVGLYSQYQQNKFQAHVASLNATIAEQNREAALKEGTEQATLSKMETGRRLGGAIAAQGANNVDVGFGSPTEVQQGIVNVGNLDAATIEYNAQRRALGFADQAAGLSAQSSMYSKAAGMTALSAPLELGSNFISGASSVAGKALAFKTAGVPGYYGGS